MLNTGPTVVIDATGNTDSASAITTGAAVAAVAVSVVVVSLPVLLAPLVQALALPPAFTATAAVTPGAIYFSRLLRYSFS